MLLYATTGNHFSSAADIRFSIVPDGTMIGGVASNLYATFNKVYGQNAWQWMIFDAAAEWSAYAGINMTYAYDDGEAIGAGAYQQGNPNMGDIRIGGYVQQSNILGYAIQPPPANGDSSSGDIFLNTGQPWGGRTGYDFETVMLHEFGHALGLDHSTDTGSVMYATYNGIKYTPDADDLNGIQAVWGPRMPDSITQATANYSFARAADLTPYINPQNNQIVLPAMNDTDPNNSYWFKVTNPSNGATSISVLVQSLYLSEFSPKVQVADSSGHLLGEADASIYSWGTITGVTINNTSPNTTYYARVIGTSGNGNGDGAYALLVNLGPYQLNAVNPTYPAIPVKASQGGGVSNDTVLDQYETGHPVRRAVVSPTIPAIPLVNEPMIAVQPLHQGERAAVHTHKVHPSRRPWHHRPAQLGEGHAAVLA